MRWLFLVGGGGDSVYQKLFREKGITQQKITPDNVTILIYQAIKYQKSPEENIIKLPVNEQNSKKNVNLCPEWEISTLHKHSRLSMDNQDINLSKSIMSHVKKAVKDWRS
ncbi:hypothetical protein G9A89_020425 [Geosiphon pyriformis]|nr:hypothetical protein G9A89_020425 [Geosiphon pyriformis]